MKLYVSQCNNCGKKIQLNITARNRSELRRIIGGDPFYLNCGNCGYRNIYSVSQVWAETETSSTVTGGVVGGIVGLIGGPIGAILGGTIGAAIGSTSDDEEKRRVNFFNHSA